MSKTCIAIVVAAALLGQACQSKTNAPAPAAATSPPTQAVAPAAAAPVTAQKDESPQAELKAKPAKKLAAKAKRSAKLARNLGKPTDKDELGEGSAPGIKLNQARPTY